MQSTMDNKNKEKSNSEKNDKSILASISAIKIESDIQEK